MMEFRPGYTEWRLPKRLDKGCRQVIFNVITAARDPRGISVKKIKKVLRVCRKRVRSMLRHILVLYGEGLIWVNEPHLVKSISRCKDGREFVRLWERYGDHIRCKPRFERISKVCRLKNVPKKVLDKNRRIMRRLGYRY